MTTKSSPSPSSSVIPVLQFLNSLMPRPSFLNSPPHPPSPPLSSFLSRSSTHFYATFGLSRIHPSIHPSDLNQDPNSPRSQGTVLFLRFNEFGTDGWPAANALGTKLGVFSKHVSSHTGFQVPELELKVLIAAVILMKGVGSLLFIFGSSLGAYLLVLHQLITTPILYDFYNYDPEKKEFVQLFTKFTQSLALFGALLFFIGMKNSMPRRQLKKKTTPKTKTV